MTWRDMDACLFLGPDAFENPGQQVTLIAFAHYANKEGLAWPEASTVGERIGMTEGSVCRHMAALVRLGWLTKVRRFRRADGGAGQWVVRLNLDRAELREVTAQDCATDRAELREVTAQDCATDRAELREVTAQDCATDRAELRGLSREPVTEPTTGTDQQNRPEEPRVGDSTELRGHSIDEPAPSPTPSSLPQRDPGQALAEVVDPGPALDAIATYTDRPIENGSALARAIADILRTNDPDMTQHVTVAGRTAAQRLLDQHIATTDGVAQILTVIDWATTEGNGSWWYGKITSVEKACQHYETIRGEYRSNQATETAATPSGHLDTAKMAAQAVQIRERLGAQ